MAGRSGCDTGMRSRAWVGLVLAVWGGAVWGNAAAAGDWARLDGAAITTALTARVLGYPDGTLQDFKADRSTLAGGGAGRWSVQGDRYCSVWPPGEVWTCYAVDRHARGLDIRFTDEAGHVTVGRYVDLR